MKILLLGGTGAMGEPLVRFLAEKRHEVYITSRSIHQSPLTNVHYIRGNAQDKSFLARVSSEHYDAIVDFMHYHKHSFTDKLDLLLNTEHYFFLSSCRVYAPSSARITEDSPRLLDCADDEAYLMSDEYALSKARCEDILRNSGKTNWTIIRPYITYNTNRMQLSVFEKEGWLYRALTGRSIVFARDLASKRTTLTHGDDVSRIMAMMVDSRIGLGETIHITGEETMTWGEILQLYCTVIEEVTGRKVNICWIEDSRNLSKIIGNTYKTKYDRLSDRSFDNSKLIRMCGKQNFTTMRKGLPQVLRSFLECPKEFCCTNLKLDAYLDKLSGDIANLSCLGSTKSVLKYLVFRFTNHYYSNILKWEDVCW